MDIIEHLAQMDLLEQEVFEDIDAPGFDFSHKEFYGCTFRRVRLQESRWIGARLEDCTFENADLSRMSPAGLSFRGVMFRGCRLMGIDWSELHRDPQVSFEECDLRYCSFVGVCLRRVPFLRCNATKARFIETDLTEADFAGTDLTDGVFEGTTLCKAKLARARGVFIDPSRNRVKDAWVSLECAVTLALSAGLRVDGYSEADPEPSDRQPSARRRSGRTD
jgi:fluoroquinolone resistance protein